jgi:hypothetical protein
MMRAPVGPVTGRRENHGALVQRESTPGSSTVLLVAARSPDTTASFSGHATSTPSKPCSKVPDFKARMFYCCFHHDNIKHVTQAGPIQ